MLLENKIGGQKGERQGEENPDLTVHHHTQQNKMSLNSKAAYTSLVCQSHLNRGQ